MSPEQEFASRAVRARVAQNIVDGLAGRPMSSFASPIEGSALRTGPLPFTSPAHLAVAGMKRASATEIDVGEMLQGLRDGSIEFNANEPRRFSVFGTFFPAHLLFEGWWNRTDSERPDIAGNEFWGHAPGGTGAIRQWLNSGYELWGPSWNLAAESDNSQYLYGQIGNGDEANSLSVVIAPGLATKLLADLRDKGSLAASVRAVGTLYQGMNEATTLSKTAKQAIATLHRNAQDRSLHFLLVDEYDAAGDRTRDSIELVRGFEPIYSAYLWQCLVKVSDLPLLAKGELTAAHATFLWEHTNLLSHDCVKFNYEALRSKRSILERLLDEQLCVLHHSFAVSDIVDGTDSPRLSQSELADILSMARVAVAQDSNVIDIDSRRGDR